jgi:uncharacterized membrane protein SpoIIM required for sporulation
VTLQRFLTERHADWEELDALVQRGGRNPRRLGAGGVRRMAALYRAAAADLARARRAYPGDPVVERLERLVGAARHSIYAHETRRGSLRQFAVRGYWQAVLERPVPLLVSAALLVVPTILAGAWAVRDPGAAGGLVPAAYRSVTEPRPSGSGLGLTAAQQTAFASSIFTHNIEVTFLAFAGGMTAGLVTMYELLQNGVLLGVVGGLSIGAGNGSRFLSLVLAHGVLELSCIVVTGAAGLRLGWALIEPGRRTRAEALQAEGVRAVAIVLGTMPWLVVAGLVEGFVTPSGFGLGAALVVGLALGALYWTLVLVRGRRASDGS